MDDDKSGTDFSRFDDIRERAKNKTWYIRKIVKCDRTGCRVIIG